MSNEYRATPDQWGDVVFHSKTASWASCVLELRARVEALEAGATCPHVVTSDDGTSYCRLAEQASPTVKESLTADSSLAERVERAIHDIEFPRGLDEARAAIREVAAWLEGQNVGAGRAAARWLREEVER